MGQGVIQLVATGAQDVALTGSPQITFFKTSYKRHTNFSEESIEQTFNGPADFGKRVTATISRNADLIGATFLQVALPQQTLTGAQRFRWLNYLGHRLIKKVEIEIGGQTIDKHYGEWLHIWYQLTCPVEKRAGYEEMIGNSHDLVLMKSGYGVPLDATCAASELTNSCVPRQGTPAKTLYIPLQFWFNRNKGLALPLIALSYHEVKITFEFETFDNCAYYDTGYTPSTAAKSLQACSLYVDYVYLDTEERRAMSQKQHEYLIEQLQFTGGESITSSAYKSRLNFNHPVKELIWVVQRDSFVQCGATQGAVTDLVDAGGQQPFNYSDDWSTDGLVLSTFGRGSIATGASTLGYTAGAATASIGGTTGFIMPQFATSSAGLAVTTGTIIGGSGETTNPNEDGSDNFIVGTTNYLMAKAFLQSGVRCEGKNPVEIAKLQLNGHDRFSEREGRYFDVVQPWQHHTGNGQTGINVYSFANRPEEHQPSGSLNFSRIDTATLHLTMSVNTIQGLRTAELRVYAFCYNVLRVVSGMAGLSYAS